MFTAKGTRVHGVPPEAIALVNQRPILRSDFITQVQTQYSVRYAETTPTQRRKVLDDMIDEEMMVQRGLDVDLPSFDPDVRVALVAGVELQLFADVLAQKPTYCGTAGLLRRASRQLHPRREMRLRDLVAVVSPRVRLPRPGAMRPRPARVCVRARCSSRFMAQFNLADSRRLLDSGHVDLGNVFDFAARARLDPAVFAAARALATGQVSEPVVAADGVHIVVMVKRVPPAQRRFRRDEQ